MKSIKHLIIALALLTSAGLSTAHAQVLTHTVLDATFTGASGAPVDTSIWNSGSGVTLDGSGNAVIGGGQLLQSNSTFSPLDAGADGNVFVTYDFTLLPTDNHYFGLMTAADKPWILVNFPGGGFQVNNGSTTVDKGITNPSGSNYDLSIYWSSANNEIEFIQGSNLSGTVLATYTASDLTLPTSGMNLDFVEYGGASSTYLNSVTVQEGALAAAPEPSSLALVLFGISGLGCLFWFRRTRSEEKLI